jgi:diguanylate cyclase (GGDEF)-like protein
VQAENSDGVWNEQGASFNFTIQPPLSRTPLAYIGYGVVALLLTWGVIVLRTQSLVRRQEELTRTVAERTAELEAEKNELEEMRRELHLRATHDTLTGLLNRAAILEHLEHEVSRAKRDRVPLGVLLADLDHFKHINDVYGHLCGDDVIRDAARRFREVLRDYDLAGRYGGEEFLILLPGMDPTLAPERVEELLDAIRSAPFESGGRRLPLTCSIGVATFHPDADSTDTRAILTRADTALYIAKNMGRDRAGYEASVSANSPLV